MTARRWTAGALAAAMVATLAVVVAPSPAAADGASQVDVTCSGIPVIGSTSTTATVNATDDVDPASVGGTVVNTLNVPVPVGDVPIEVTVTELKLTVPIPTGVSVTGVAFTASSFSGQTWAVQGSNLVATLTGSVPLGGGAPAPTVPDVAVTTTVAGPARTVSWTVPTSIAAKATWALGSFTATCTPADAGQVLITTEVVQPNRPPVATDQTIQVPHDTPTAVTLGGTDPDDDPIDTDQTSLPDHGELLGVAPDLTYVPEAGFSGVDSFDFIASDGDLWDIGTITLVVAPAVATVPEAPTIAGVDVAQGYAKVRWTPPLVDGGSAITSYLITSTVDGQPGPSLLVGPDGRDAEFTTLDDGATHTFSVAATNAVGTGPAATSAEVTPQWWLPWSSGPVAVTEVVTWMTGTPPTAGELSGWLARLDAGTLTVGGLVDEVRDGADALANVDPTIRLYSAYLVRVPDAGGLNFWLRRRRAGYTLSRISSFFEDSSEFTTRYGTLTNRQFVEQIYRNVLGREGEESGIAYWTRQLDLRRKDRGQVMINFSESSEYIRVVADRVDAAAVLIHVIGVSPTTGQRDALVAAAGSSSLADAVRELLRDPAFAARAG